MLGTAKVDILVTTINMRSHVTHVSSLYLSLNVGGLMNLKFKVEITDQRKAEGNILRKRKPCIAMSKKAKPSSGEIEI